MHRSRNFVGGALAAALALALPEPAAAVFSGEMSPRPPSGDADYAAAIRAKDDEDWVRMINNLLRVVDRRPWHDNAHTLLGYGYRKLGRFERSLEHYRRALEHNPRHRGALEYMAVTYLHMGRPEDALAARARLERVCRQVTLTFSDGAFGDGCEELRLLDTALGLYRESGEIVDCIALDDPAVMAAVVAIWRATGEVVDCAAAMRRAPGS
jgi:tetratricopeptide (TPR) repeat protein